MSEFVRICPISELPRPGEVVEMIVDGKTLCIAHAGGTVAVLDGVCPHEGGPLGEGSIEGGRVVCPWHSFSFDLHSGESEQDPELKAQVFESKIEGDELLARL
jgi:nitrite reductase (NADH) small subunit